MAAVTSGSERSVIAMREAAGRIGKEGVRLEGKMSLIAEE